MTRLLLLVGLTLAGGLAAGLAPVEGRRSHQGFGAVLVAWALDLGVVWTISGEHALPPGLSVLEAPLVLLLFPASLAVVVQSSRRLAKGQTLLLLLPLLAAVASLLVLGSLLAVGSAVSGARVVG